MKPSLFNENDITIIKGNPFDTDSIKTPQQAESIEHTQEYIYSVDKKGNHLRRIFYNQKFNQFEKDKIQEYRTLLKENNIELPTEWSDLKILKYIYNEQFNKKDFINQIKKHIIWLNNEALQNPSEATLDKYLNQGVMYTFGRDKFYRPIVYVNSYQIKADSNNVDDMNALNGSLCRLLSMVQKKMFLEGKIENWIICIDTNNCGITEIDFKVIAKIVECMVANYTCILHKLVLLNPSWSFRQCWKIISAFIPSDTQSKIDFLTKDEFHKLVEMGIEPDQIQQKYGGTHENLTSFCQQQLPLTNNRPPKCTFQSNNNFRFATPSRKNSSHYHSMIDHSNFLSREETHKDFIDQELTQDGMNIHSKNILEEKQFNNHNKNQYANKNQLNQNTLALQQDQIDQPHPSSSKGCCSQNSCQIF